MRAAQPAHVPRPRRLPRHVVLLLLDDTRPAMRRSQRAALSMTFDADVVTMMRQLLLPSRCYRRLPPCAYGKTRA